MSLGDLLYNFTEWLRTTQLIELTLWISDTPFSLWIQTHFWAIPTIQTIHIICIALLFGSALMVNLRVLGFNSLHRTPAQMVERFGPVIRWSLIGLLVSGLLLVVGEPIRELINPIFWVKMALVIVTVLLSIRFNHSVSKVTSSDVSLSSLRIGAVLLIVLWCAVMAGGRWIAYAPV